MANASLTGNLGGWGIQFPWANDGVGIAFGVEYRKESLELLTDSAFSTLPSSDLAGQGAPTLPVAGDFDVREAFVEVRIPIVEDNFFHYLSLEARLSLLGLRASAAAASTPTPTRSASTSRRSATSASAPATTARSARRTSRSCSRRSASSSTATTDPCAGVGVADRRAARRPARRMGVSAGQYGTIQPNPAGQYNGLIGGNPNLDPEVADT